MQQSRPAPNPPLVNSDSDSEDEEDLVSRLMPPSKLHQPVSGTKGSKMAWNTHKNLKNMLKELKNCCINTFHLQVFGHTHIHTSASQKCKYS